MVPAKSAFTITATIFLICLKIISAPLNDGEGTSSQILETIHYVDYDSLVIPAPSTANTCFVTFVLLCSMYSPTLDGCAKQGIVNWPRIEPNVPIFVEDYYKQFQEYLIADEFQLPSEFCNNEALERIRQLPTLDYFKLLSDCNESLKDFQAKPSTLQNSKDMNLNEFRQQIRQDILQYAFYGIRYDDFDRRSLQKKYINHIIAYTQVDRQMDSPKAYCIKRYLLFNTTNETAI